MTLRVLRFPLAGRVSAADVFRVLHGDDTDVFWLDGGSTSYVGAGERWYAGGPDGVLGALREESARQPRQGLGLVGWLGYELLSETVGADAKSFGSRRTSRHPIAAFLRVRRAVAVDRDGSAELLAFGHEWSGELERWRQSLVERLEDVLPEGAAAETAAVPPAPADPVRPPTVRWRDTDDQYLGKIAACQAAIRAGEAYVLNLTTEVTVTAGRQAGRQADTQPDTQAPLDPVAVYRRLRATSPSRHGALLRIGGVSLLSSSPELFLEVDSGGRVRTSPVKGTRARAEHPRIDRAAAGELAANAKERAENTMIVDLMRNDLARVSVPGSISVPSMLTVETHPQVHQLVSTVEGQLRPGLGVVDALRAAFPAGSMTGTPKRSAIEILDRLEDRPRGLYAGTFGWLGVDGRAELAMTIRSIVIDDAGATIGVGGGITALSVPREELAEVKLKAAALLAALGVPPVPGGG